MVFYKQTTILLFLLLIFFLPIYSQTYPDKIRGYKVYQTEIAVKSEKGKSSENKNAEAVVKIGEPELLDVSLTGITLQISAEIEGVEQSGKIDFLSFEDFKINGLNVEIEEYNEPFKLKKGEKNILPKPVKIFVSTGQTLRGAYRESKDSKNEWTVSGRVFIFGKFKKMGLSFKRVVPVEINLKIENPVKKKLAQNDKSS